jgi:hypothetical protein
MQPGETIAPGGEPADKPDDQKSETNSASPEPTNHHTELPIPQPAPEVVQAQEEPTEPEPSTWQYSSEGQPDAQPMPDIPTVSWSASEYIEHEKAATWFLGLGVIAVLLAAIIFLITHDVVTTGAIILAAGLFGVAGARKPRTLDYQLDTVGVHIGSKTYGYNNFKSFSVIEEGALSSVQLLPLKRFMPPISLYYPPDQEDQILGVLGSYLPHEIHSHDPIDRLMRKVRF